MKPSLAGSGQLGIPGPSPISLSSDSKSQASKSTKEQKIGHRRVDEDGQVTYKRKPTSELMSAIQLGIGQSIGGLSPKPKRDVLYGDFDVVESLFFPREGSNSTPAHRYSDFRFKTYAPVAFRYFRDLFGIQPEDFLLSLCNEPLKELSNPGASGSIFYLSNDDEFIIKTVQHKEADFLQKLLPGYYMNLNQNPRTLLPKFYGLYCYQCGGKNIRFIIMNNLLPSTIEMHCKFDLKGSTFKRKASAKEIKKSHPTYKDLDFLELFPEGLIMEPETYSALVKTIERDCRVLQSFKIMDYSMLIGLHRFPRPSKQFLEAPSEEVFERDGCRSRSNRIRMAQFSTAMESIHAETEQELLDSSLGGIPAHSAQGENLVLFVGIIDVLQSYRFSKKLEHTFKSFLTDGDTISVHRPGFYAQRFQTFFAAQVFKKVLPPMRQTPSKKKSLTDRQKLFAGEGLEYIDDPPSKDVLPVSSSPLPPYSMSRSRIVSVSSRASSNNVFSDDATIHSSAIFQAFYPELKKNSLVKFNVDLSEKSAEEHEFDKSSRSLKQSSPYSTVMDRSINYIPRLQIPNPVTSNHPIGLVPHD